MTNVISGKLPIVYAVAVPGVIGEVSLAIWLLVRGNKISVIKQKEGCL